MRMGENEWVEKERVVETDFDSKEKMMDRGRGYNRYEQRENGAWEGNGMNPARNGEGEGEGGGLMEPAVPRFGFHRARIQLTSRIWMTKLNDKTSEDDVMATKYRVE